MMNWDRLQRIADEVGDSFYIFDSDKFTNNIKSLTDSFRNIYNNSHLGYSYKTNYTPEVCALAAKHGCYAEVVSGAEYELAITLGVNPNRIIFNGPARSEEFLIRAVREGALINIDSMRDLKIIERASKMFSKGRVGVGIRCNFRTSYRDDSRFGFDVESDEVKEALSHLRQSQHVKLVGLHCHLPDRSLKSVQERAGLLIEFARATFVDEPPQFINFGGGLYGSLPSSLGANGGKSAPTFDEYADVIAGLMNKYFGKLRWQPELLLEPGTSVVADTFRFACKVISVKTVRGKRIATVSGSIFNVSPNSKTRNLPVTVVRKNEERRNAISSESIGPHSNTDIVGYTCIESDILSEHLSEMVEEGDFLVFSNVGSYSVVMKPPFIMPQAAIIVFEEDKRNYSIIRPAETADDMFGRFVLYNSTKRLGALHHTRNI
jgi:diaminopimelate decarboxylase